MSLNYYFWQEMEIPSEENLDENHLKAGPNFQSWPCQNQEGDFLPREGEKMISRKK